MQWGGWHAVCCSIAFLFLTQILITVQMFSINFETICYPTACGCRGRQSWTKQGNKVNTHHGRLILTGVSTTIEGHGDACWIAAQLIGENDIVEFQTVPELGNSIRRQSSLVNEERQEMVFVREVLPSLPWERSSVSKYSLDEIRNWKGYKICDLFFKGHVKLNYFFGH
jgi:hypothetical protein